MNVCWNILSFPHVSGIRSTQTDMEVFKELIKYGVYIPSMKNIFTQNLHCVQNMGWIFVESFWVSPHVSGIWSTQTHMQVFKEIIKYRVYTPSVTNIFTKNLHYLQNMGWKFVETSWVSPMSQVSGPLRHIWKYSKKS
jgi:hypothetical protein